MAKTFFSCGFRLPTLRRMPLMLGLLGALAGALAQANDGASVPADALKLARRVCVGCHGPAGHASSPLFPHLAGQTATYIAAELRAFKNHQRSEPEARDYMWGIAASLDDGMIDTLASYYAQQPPTAPTSGDPALVRSGEQLFREGDPTRRIPACVSCHGPRGEGLGQIPRIASQQSAYVARQMHEMKAGLRAAPTMKTVIDTMNGEEIEALAAFLAAQ